MNYDDACEAVVTRAEAIAEIKKHDSPDGIEAFFEDVGDKPFYKEAEVLGWLGY